MFSHDLAAQTRLVGKQRRMGDLEVEFDLDRERLEWRVQRISWVIMLIITVAALLGVFGSGFLSKAKAGDAGLQIEYARLSRYQAPAELRIRCQVTEGEAIRLLINRAFISMIENEQFSPAPREQTLKGEAYEYVFAKSSQQEQLITLHFESTEFGRSHATMTLNGGPTVSFTQFFWP